MNKPKSDEQFLLAGDVGGTKTNLAIYSTAASAKEPVHFGTLPSGQYPSLEALAEDYLHKAQCEVDAACFGIAGPVIDGEVNFNIYHFSKYAISD